MWFFRFAFCKDFKLRRLHDGPLYVLSHTSHPPVPIIVACLTSPGYLSLHLRLGHLGGIWPICYTPAVTVKYKSGTKYLEPRSVTLCLSASGSWRESALYASWIHWRERTVSSGVENCKGQNAKNRSIMFKLLSPSIKLENGNEWSKFVAELERVFTNPVNPIPWLFRFFC